MVSAANTNSSTGAAKRPTTVWVVDDDPELRNLLTEYLEKEGYLVRTMISGRDVVRRIARERPDVLVLDRMLGEEDGIDICRTIRNTGDDVPIIMLTALGAAVDRIEGIEAGADDYIAKPFLPRELTVRIDAIMRRRKGMPVGAPVVEESYAFGNCVLNFAARQLTKDGKDVPITSTEFALLRALVLNAHRPLTRERLVEMARGPGVATIERSIDVHISRVRRLVELEPANPKHIQTVWGYGYVFVPENESVPR